MPDNENNHLEQGQTSWRWPMGVDDPRAKRFLTYVYIWTIVLKFGYENSLLVGPILSRSLLLLIGVWLACQLTVFAPLAIYFSRTELSGSRRFHESGVVFIVVLSFLKAIVDFYLLKNW